MDEIGLFPLDLVIVPSERVPLHIFEPRYKELIGECLAEDGEFGLLLEDDTGLREIGTRAAVIKVLEIFDDGRMNVVVEGRERFRVVDLTGGRSFQTADVEPVEDDDLVPPEPDAVERARAVFRKLVEVTETEVDEPSPDAEPLSFELAARVDLGSELKQELLEFRSERARLERLAELFELAAEGVKEEREVQERASRNGKVSPR